jgi:hypothetical protein
MIDPNSVDYQLRMAPKLLTKLRKQYGNQIDIDNIDNPGPGMGPAESPWYKTVKLSVRGKPIGTFKELQYIDGPGDHSFQNI